MSSLWLTGSMTIMPGLTNDPLCPVRTCQIFIYFANVWVEKCILQVQTPFQSLIKFFQSLTVFKSAVILLGTIFVKVQNT